MPKAIPPSTEPLATTGRHDTPVVPDPGRPLIVFDGGCGMCRRQMRLVRWLDWAGRFESLEYDDAVRSFPEVSRGVLGDGLRVRFPDASVVVGIDAVSSISLRMPLTALPAVLLYVPGLHWVGARAYGAIARRRQRSSACAMPGQR